MKPASLKIIVAGVGNLLRGDDGFGVIVVRHLLEQPVPDGVLVLDIGIGGLHLVQALLDPVDALVVIDAMDLGRPPGTVLVVRPDVFDVTTLPLAEKHDQLAGLHYATPERTFMLAKALGVLPPTWMVGCQPVDAEKPLEELSPPVLRAIPAAAAEVRALVTAAGILWE